MNHSLPHDDSGRAVRRDAANADAYTPTATSKRTWPVLARIGDVSRSETPVAKHETKPAVAAERTYRVDTPHISVATAPEATPAPRVTEPKKLGPSSAAKSKSKARSTGYLHRLPGVIRFAIRTWLVLLPYRSLIRAAAMFMLMGITGAGTMVMMGDHLQPENSPPDTTSAATDQPAPKQATADPGILEPELEPSSQPEASTIAMPPTASGPLSSERRELVAIEKQADESEEKNLAPETVAESEPATPENAATAAPAVNIYPTTPYPEITIAQGDATTVPRVQTTEPAPEVARFEGTIEQVKPR